METAQTVGENTMNVSDAGQQPTTPIHQYAAVAPSMQQSGAITSPYKPESLTEQVVSAAAFGAIVVATGTMGANLHKVQQGDMGLGQSVNNSLVNGLKGGIAAGSATAAAKTLTAGGAIGLAVTLVAATGVSYLLNK